MIEEYSFGAWIRRRRKGLDLTQQELAHRINCSLSTIGKIESDQRRPSRQIAELLAKHLCIPENQRELFLKVARGLKPVDHLKPFPLPLEALLKTTAGRKTCLLPVPTNPLVGRIHELAEIVGLLTLSECRLLTIVGLGGVGKTRLALQVAHDLSNTIPFPFQDGLCFVPLASVISTQHIPKAIAGAIGFEISGPLSPENQLLNFLTKRTMLLVVDNFEHLLDGVEIFSKILERAPAVKLLVTSRERLNMSCEWVFDLQGLPVPPSDTDEELENYSAVRLFMDRVQQAKTDFSLRKEDQPVVGQICRMLDGIPLGIELAAAWVRALPLCEIATEITNDLDFLTSSARDIPERHRSLRVVFDHSWRLLSSAEQRTLHQLSTFKGGFTREAAEEVAEIHLSILNSLIDKSLLRRSEPARYELHELVRVYAATRLANKPEEEASAQERHSRLFLSLVRDARPDLQSNRQKEALVKLSVELANIRSAWEWAVTHNQIDLLREAAWSLWYFFDLRSYYREAEAVFAKSANMVRSFLKDQQAEMSVADQEKFAGALGQFLMHQAYFAMRLGEVDEADVLCQDSISLLRPIDDPETLAHALTYYAVLNYTVGKQDQAWNLLHESLPLSKEYGPPWQVALFTGILGNVAYELGEYEKSFQLLDEAFRCSKAIGDPRLTGYITANLCRTALKLKRTRELDGILREGALSTHESDDRFGYGLILEQLALVAQARGEYNSAEKLFESSVDLFWEIGDAGGLARVLNSWGNFSLLLNESQQAAERFRQAIRLSLDVGANPTTLSALVGLAKVYKREGKVESARDITIFVLDHPASTQDTRASAQQTRRDLESHLAKAELHAMSQRTPSYTLEEFANSYL